MGGAYVLFAESAQIRSEWKEKLEHAIGLRKVVQESNKAFEVETLSSDTFLMPLYANTTQGPAWEQGNTFTGRVTCSVPFSEFYRTVWVNHTDMIVQLLPMGGISLQSDVRRVCGLATATILNVSSRAPVVAAATYIQLPAMRRVLQLKAVTQCAMLESFGIFLVLADKVCRSVEGVNRETEFAGLQSLFAYHIEALVPSSPHSNHTNLIPQKLNGTKDVHFFSVGMLQNRTLVAYMKKKGVSYVSHCQHPSL